MWVYLEWIWNMCTEYATTCTTWQMKDKHIQKDIHKVLVRCKRTESVEESVDDFVKFDNMLLNKDYESLSKKFVNLE